MNWLKVTGVNEKIPTFLDFLDSLAIIVFLFAFTGDFLGDSGPGDGICDFLFVPTTATMTTKFFIHEYRLIFCSLGLNSKTFNLPALNI